jgi:hypothetical protein
MVADKEAHVSSPLPEHQQQVAGLLGDPGTVRVGGHPGEMDPSGVQFDEEQHVEPPEPHGVDGEEVAGHDPGGLLAQERPPGAVCTSWRRVEPVAAKRGTDRGGRDPNSQVQQLSLDPLIAPPGVLLCETDDQLLHLLVQRWPAGLAVRVGPGTGDQSSVPAQ